MITPDPRTSIYAAIGLVVSSWALVEQLLDICVHHIYYDYGGKSIAQTKGIPHTLNKKIEFLNDCFANDDLPSLYPYKKLGMSFIPRINSLFDKRHNNVHGAISELTANYVIFRKFKSKSKDKFEYIKYKTTELLGYGKLMQDLAMDMAPYVQSLSDNLAK